MRIRTVVGASRALGIRGLGGRAFVTPRFFNTLRFLRYKNKNRWSQYNKSLGISYPEKRDVEYARKAGKPSCGDVKIHGIPNDDKGHDEEYTSYDWTRGCIAVTNTEIEELYSHIDVGATVFITP